MSKTVLNLPVQLVASGPEPTLLELIARYYVDHLPYADAIEAALTYVRQIQAAESFLRVDFAKYVVNKLDLPEGVTAEDLLNQAAEQIVAEEADALFPDPETATDVIVGGNPNEPTFDDGPDIEFRVFISPVEVDAFLNKAYPKHG